MHVSFGLLMDRRYRCNLLGGTGTGGRESNAAQVPAVSDAEVFAFSLNFVFGLMRCKPKRAEQS